MWLDKWYIARAKFGQLTNTLDFTGVCLQDEDVSAITSAMLKEYIHSFGTSYEQIPPYTQH
jgi:tRNA U55 pseudouridine synthase TruB